MRPHGGGGEGGEGEREERSGNNANNMVGKNETTVADRDAGAEKGGMTDWYGTGIAHGGTQNKERIEFVVLPCQYGSEVA